MEKKKTTIPNMDALLEDAKKLHTRNTSKTLFFLREHQEVIEEYLKINISYSGISKHIQKIYSQKISSEAIRKFSVDQLGTEKWKNRKPNKISISEKILENNLCSFPEILDLLTDKEKSFLDQKNQNESQNSISGILKYAKENFTFIDFKSIEDFLNWVENKQREEDEEIIDVVRKIEKYFLSEKDYQFSSNDIKFFGDEKTFLKITKLLEKRNPHKGKDLRFFAIDIRNDYADYLSVIYN